jgi:hypothetical protein
MEQVWYFSQKMLTPIDNPDIDGTVRDWIRWLKVFPRSIQQCFQPVFDQSPLPATYNKAFAKAFGDWTKAHTAALALIYPKGVKGKTAIRQPELDAIDIYLCHRPSLAALLNEMLTLYRPCKAPRDELLDV